MNVEKLVNDLETAYCMMEYIKIHQDENYNVAVRNYLDPWFFPNRVMPMNNSLGLFMYYREIAEALESALNDGFVPKDKIPKSSPDYLEDLAM